MQCIRPKYVKFFQCDGSQCASRCCRGWRVAIDEGTHQRFLALDDHDWITDKLERLDGENFFSVRLNDDGSCPFLDADSLCSLQKRYGEDSLAAICQAYPRVTYQLDQMLEQSLTLTCPLAARLILLPSEPIQFETVKLDRPRFCFDWTKRVPSAERAIELQFKAIECLQDRALSLDRRLLELCRLLGDPIEPKNLRAEFDVQRHADIMLDVFIKMYSAATDESKRRQIKNIFIDNRASMLTRLRLGFEFVLENYLVNEFFMRCYPFTFDGAPWFNCRTFIVGFKAMEFALILNVISKFGRLSVDDLLNMIDALNERLDHNRGGMTAVREAARSLDAQNEFIAAMLDWRNF